MQASYGKHGMNPRRLIKLYRVHSVLYNNPPIVEGPRTIRTGLVFANKVGEGITYCTINV